MNVTHCSRPGLKRAAGEPQPCKAAGELCHSHCLLRGNDKAGTKNFRPCG